MMRTLRRGDGIVAGNTCGASPRSWQTRPWREAWRRGATVMIWHGINGGVAAAAAGHDVVMTPNTHASARWSGSSMSIAWLKRRNARSNAAWTSSGSSTRTQASRSLVSATVRKNFIAAACRVCRRGNSSTFEVSAPCTSAVEKIASASCSVARQSG